jgi:ABC-type transport system involved in multi-copper enzyme maturation permease subunit
LWSRLCGPVFLYDLVRLSRRGKATFFVARSLYVSALLVLLVLIYALQTGQHSPFELWSALCMGFPLAQSRASSFASEFCHALLATQLAVAVLLTPAFTAGAISEDRERRTLEFLLTSDLSSREIILGKWLAYLARPALVLVAGLPVLGVVQLLGGVDPDLILAAFAATFLTMASLGAVGMLVSLHTARPYAAILFTYGITAGYYLLSGCPTGSLGLDAVLGAGNPLIALARLEHGIASGRSLEWLPHIFLDYALFHGVITFLALTCCIRQLRRPRVRTLQDAAEALLRRHVSQLPPAAAFEAAQAKVPLAATLPQRPEVSAHPILWRELYVETGLSQTRDFFGFLLTASIWVGVILIGMSLLLVVLNDPSFLSEWVRWVGTSVACLLLLGVALRAAGSFTRERERRTLDNLLASPLSDQNIVSCKLLGSLLSVRRGFFCLALVWLLGIVSGCLKPYAVPVLLVIWVGYAFLAASVGVFCSLYSRSTWRATVLTLLIVPACWVLPDLLCLPVFSPPEALMFFASVGQPDAVQPLGMKRESLYEIFVCFVFEHYLGTLLFWHLTMERFSAATGRIEGVRRWPAFTHPPKRSALPSPPSRSLC